MSILIGLPLADSIIPATAITFDAAIQTQNYNFENIAGVKFS